LRPGWSFTIENVIVAALVNRNDTCVPTAVPTLPSEEAALNLDPIVLRNGVTGHA
jgi:hypothetical protein